MNYVVRPIEKSKAKQLIVENHYSHKWSSCRYALGLFGSETLLGVAVYGYPVGRLVIPSISPVLKKDEVLELTRFWTEDDTPKNTESYFLGQTFKWLKNNTNIKCLISYSDPMYGHQGIIYQATNWLYQGNDTMKVKGYLHRVNGELLHPRSCVAKYETTKPTKLKEIDPNYTRIPLQKKHRYIYILDKRSKRQIMKTLKHPIVSYPNENTKTTW